MNHSYLDASAGLLEQLKNILSMQDDVLKSDPEELKTGTTLATKVSTARVAMLTQVQQREDHI